MSHISVNPSISRELDSDSHSFGRRNIEANSPTIKQTASHGLIALSMEFVAKPQEAYRFQKIIPSLLTEAFKGVTGFAGCLVMVSDQEARLVTVVTLWAGESAHERSAKNARWVHTLLAPFIDRQLRAQFLIAFVPVLHADGAEAYSTGEYSILQPLPLQREEVCVA